MLLIGPSLSSFASKRLLNIAVGTFDEHCSGNVCWTLQWERLLNIAVGTFVEHCSGNVCWTLQWERSLSIAVGTFVEHCRGNVCWTLQWVVLSFADLLSVSKIGELMRISEPEEQKILVYRSKYINFFNDFPGKLTPNTGDNLNQSKLGKIFCIKMFCDDTF